MADINWFDQAKETPFAVKNIISGRSLLVEGTTKLENRAPYDGQVLYEFGEVTIEEVDRAVNAARQSFEDGRWSKKSISERHTFEDETEAIAIANKSHFGLAAHIATENLSRAHRVSQSLNVGLIIVSGHSESIGGYVDIGTEPQRESGMGFEGGLAGLEAFRVCSSIHMMI